MPRKIWGFEVKELGWKNEDDTPFDPDAVYPVLDVIGNRVYAIDKVDESDVAVVHSYGIKTQPGAAISFATMVWGRPKNWERPDISSRVVSCLGAPACYACIEHGQDMAVSLANDWRLDPMNDSDVQFEARQLIDAGDPITEHLTDAHAMALNLLPPEFDPRADAEQTRLERIYGQDIAGKLSRGWSM